MHVSILCEETNDPNIGIRLHATNYAFPFAPQTVYLEKLKADVPAFEEASNLVPWKEGQARRNS